MNTPLYGACQVKLTTDEAAFIAKVMGTEDFGLKTEFSVDHAWIIHGQLEHYEESPSDAFDGRMVKIIRRSLEHKIIEAERHPFTKQGLPVATEDVERVMRLLTAHRLRGDFQTFKQGDFAFELEGDGPRKMVTLTIDREVDGASLRLLLARRLGRTAGSRVIHRDGKTVCTWLDPIAEAA